MISLTNIGKQLTSFIRRNSPLTVEEMCPITLAILCYRYTTYDMAEATAGERDDWEALLAKMDSGDVEPKFWLQTVLLESADLYRDRGEMFELYDRITQVMHRLPKGELCTECDVDRGMLERLLQCRAEKRAIQLYSEDAWRQTIGIGAL